MKMRNWGASCIVVLAMLVPFCVNAKSIWSPLTDTVNSGIINTKIMSDNSLSHADIDATVVNGVAIFSGQVNSKEQADKLISIAHSVSGITGVNTGQLKVGRPNSQ